MSCYKILFICFLGFLLNSCHPYMDQMPIGTQSIFTILEGDSTVLMDGVINQHSLDNFNKLYRKFPSIKKIEIRECEGSMDDETNLQLSKRVNSLNIDTHLQDNGLIASGGVDFFLAGIKRTRGSNVTVGVHSWSDGNSVQATDFPVGHAHHLPYINYYVSIGFTQQLAEDFYYFTINAAVASEIHNMTESEIQTYTIFTH